MKPRVTIIYFFATENVSMSSVIKLLIKFLYSPISRGLHIDCYSDILGNQ